MTCWGYTLSSEEHHPSDLVRAAARAEELGFDFLSISDHYHPWTTSQGHSALVWSTIGGVASVTRQIPLGVGVACPMIRVHPAIVAQAAATCAAMLERRPGRSGGGNGAAGACDLPPFFLGVGSGEALNEHITGEHWPVVEVRHEMLAEAVAIMRELWTGQTVDHRGPAYTVENARIFTLPSAPPPVIVSAFGEAAAGVAAEIGDGLWSHGPESEIVDRWRSLGGRGPTFAQLNLCWDRDRERAIDTAMRVWPNAGVPGQLSQDLPTWTHFEQASQLVTRDMIAETITCGPDPEPVVEVARTFVDAGFDHIHLHQIGPDQDGFFEFWSQELGPALRDAVAVGAGR
jgi:coenzyme F420-dependent glucose-6-phosphate dehydrogenase